MANLNLVREVLQVVTAVLCVVVVVSCVGVLRALKAVKREQANKAEELRAERERASQEIGKFFERISEARKTHSSGQSRPQ